MVRTGLTDQAVGMAATVTVNDVLDGHVGLDVECLDRIYLNGYVPNLQVGGQVVSFMTQHLGCPIPSPAIMWTSPQTVEACTMRSSHVRDTEEV